jgi:hypothetical protein
MTTFSITMTADQIDKIFTHVESMIELCDTPEEQGFYQELYDELSNQIHQQMKQ